jgi:lysophospholipase L1-like esterase
MSRHPKTRQRQLRVAAQLVVLVLLVGGLAGLAFRSFERAEPGHEAAGNSADAGKPMFSPRPALLVITDSMGGGVGDPSIVKNYPRALADTMGWDLNVDAVGASGYLETHLTKQRNHIDATVAPFIDRLEADSKNYRADYILVDGGRNDLGKPPDEVAPAIDEYMTQLRAHYPDATIVVMTPSYITDYMADNYPMLSERIRASAERIGAFVLDPVAEGWWKNIDLKPLLWTDGVHLNSQGVDVYADKVAQGMRRFGISEYHDPKAGTQ